MNMKNTITAAIAVALLVGHAGLAAADPEFDQKMNNFVESSIEAFGVIPGFSICVVKGNEILYLESFGTRDMERNLPVTAETGFYIASATKSFTGMAASVLASRGTLDLDAPVSRYLPGLVLPEPLAADNITLRAMLTHRTGVDNKPVQRQLAFVNSLSKGEFFELMLTQSKPMPNKFIYTNLGYNMFGYVLEEVTGTPWQQVVTEAVIQPLGMTHTTTSIDLAIQGNFAFPYTLRGDDYQREKFKNDSTMHAAGGLVTTTSDLARWLIANLNQGRLEGREALAPEVVQTAHTSYATTDREYYRFRRTGYGLGWYHSDFAGELLMHHFGGFDGYHAHISFMLEHGIGVAALLNTDAYESSKLTHMAASYAYETLLGHPKVDKEYAEELAYRSARTHGKKRFSDQLAEAMDMFGANRASEGTESLLIALKSAREADVISTGEINNLGYSLLGEEQIEPATAVFRFNVDASPESPNAHDSLGEAYEKAGQIELARESYTTAFDLAKTSDDRNAAVFKENLDRVTAILR